MRNKNIKFSIIVPTNKNINNLNDLFTRFNECNYDFGKYEVIVVFNKLYPYSEKQNQKLIKAKLHILHEDKAGPSFARNKGIAKSKYPNIICIDDDVLPPRDFLSRYSEILNKYPNTVLAAGRVVAISKEKEKLKYWLNVVGKENHWLFSQTNRKENKLTALKFPDDLISANILINRNILKGKVFNEKFGRMFGKNLVFSEDLVLTLNTLFEGKKVLYDPAIVSKHIIGSEKLSYKYILNRFFRSGVEHRLLNQEFKDRNIVFYKWSTKKFLKYILAFIKKPSGHNIINVIREILFLVGYYWPTNWL